MSPRPAVVFGLLHAGLAIVRGLGRAGTPVTGIAWRGNEFALSSRYVGERVLLGDNGLRSPGDALLDTLHRIADGGRVVLFPERDENVELVLDRWDEVREVADVPLPADPDVARRLRRKEILVLEAEKAGVPAPRTVLASDEKAIGAAALQPPFLVKPAEGQEFAATFGEKAVVAQSLDDAVAAWLRAREHGFDTIVQELVPDATDHIYSLFTYVGRSGDRSGASRRRKVRLSPIDFGTSAVFEATTCRVEEQASICPLSGVHRVRALRMAHDGGTAHKLTGHTPRRLGRAIMTRAFDSPTWRIASRRDTSSRSATFKRRALVSSPDVGSRSSSAEAAARRPRVRRALRRGRHCARQLRAETCGRSRLSRTFATSPSASRWSTPRASAPVRPRAVLALARRGLDVDLVTPRRSPTTNCRRLTLPPSRGFPRSPRS